MSDIDHALAQARELLTQLRAGRADAYLDLYRLLLPRRLTAGEIEDGLTDAELRRLRRQIVINEALECLDALMDGDPAQFAGLMKKVVTLGVPPERVVRQTYEQLLFYWRRAERKRAAGCLDDLSDPSPHITLLDHLVWLDEDPPHELGAASLDRL